VDLDRATLVRFLKNQHPEYYGKVAEVRDVVAGWLSYVPQTFPHYTRHTIDHSEEIILQISKLLFRNDDDMQPVLATLSGVEAYILIVTAYLHDAGMVTSDAEKVQILTSAEWKAWVESGGGANRWRDIETFAAGNTPADVTARTFIADIQRRFLIAEFIRRSHHSRSARVVRQHHEALGRLAFGDETLADTIADICEAHGFRTHELDNHEKFPDRRDLRDGTVNVQLMAILLRLGDLLDMSTDRACPLLLNAACPLPADSYAHWTQYKRIKHRMTSSDRLEIRAECMDQDEHRYLHDWCTWLVEETRAASILTSRARRHGEWRPPEAEIEGPVVTIAIRPHRDATYIPSTWTFELDRDAILHRLIYDAYEAKETFVRELIQNAADASRCALYSILPAGSAPESPTRLEAGLRAGYPITITLATRSLVSPMSGEPEEKQVVTIEDRGIGMDRHTIEHYFLQIGRSFYTTEEFRRAYGFTPTSRFGVGFLSAFAVSDNIEVETLRQGSSDGALLLKLRGPRTYLLTDRSPRTHAGTRITLVLRETLPVEGLVAAIRHWCKRVEFPVVVKSPMDELTIESEHESEFTKHAADLSTPGTTIRVCAFPIATDGVEGELYISQRDSNDYMTWFDYEWDRNSYSMAFPLASTPHPPACVYCVSGIDRLMPAHAHMQRGSDYSRITARFDNRGTVDLPLSRTGFIDDSEIFGVPAIKRTAIAVVKEHLRGSTLASGLDSVDYRQHLASHVDIDELWHDEPMITLCTKGVSSQLSHRELADLALVGISLTESLTNESASEIPCITQRINELSVCTLRAVLANRELESVVETADGYVGLFRRNGVAGRIFHAFSLLTLPPSLIGIRLPTIWDRRATAYVLNEAHEFIQWLIRFDSASRDHEGLRRIFERFLLPLRSAFSPPVDDEVLTLNELIKGLRMALELSVELKPPVAELTIKQWVHTEPR